MAKDAAIKGSGEGEALEYGLSLRGKGYGEEVEILADIIEYGEANPDSEVNTLLSEFAEETAVDKTANNDIIEEYIPYMYSRPTYADGQVEAVWEAWKSADGKVYDPSGQEIIWDRSKPRKGQWDMGHIPGQKYSDMHTLFAMGALSRREFLDWYRNPANYRPELPKTNRSHKYE